MTPNPQPPTPDTRHPTLYVDVAVNAPIGHGMPVLSYSVPARLIPDGLALLVGHLVAVPLGKRVAQGIVVAVGGAPAVPEVRDILEILDPRPVVSPAQIALARWISHHYAASFSDGLRLMLPVGVRQRTVTWIERIVADVSGEGLTPRELAIWEALGERGRETLPRLRERLRAQGHRRGVNYSLDRLVRFEILRKRSELEPPSVKPRRERAIRIVAGPEEIERLAETLGRAKKQKAILTALAGRYPSGGTVPFRQLQADLGASPAVIAGLAARGVLEVVEVEVRRDPLADRPIPVAQAAQLTPAQAAVCARIAAALTPGPSPTGGSPHPLPAVPEPVPILGEGVGRAPAPLPFPQYRGPAQERRRGDEGCNPAGPRPSPTGRGVGGEDGSHGRVFLLHGVTSSGKTEVYLHLLAEVIAGGGQGIVLVPEIALTPQMVQRFASRFPGRVAIQHSRLSPGEQFDEWRRARAGDVDIVVGSRSALFAPLERLRIIVVDEEHEPSYKQDESRGYPGYHARDAAVQLGRILGGVTVLGSATPDVCSRARALAGEWELVELGERVAVSEAADPVSGRPAILRLGASPSPAQLVDLRAELRAGNSGIFSGALQQAVQTALSQRQQVILFLNRRGTATFVICHDCGFVLRCRRCDVPLAYHGASEDLVCHLCNRRSAVPPGCPSCYGTRVSYYGLGTQKVEEETKRAFPEARVLRWDRDSASGKRGHEQILDRFVRHEADILVGTQMLAKGLDLPGVTLVGVINADVTLNLPYYRAVERTFQLLTQVAGRAGRGPSPGRVIIQTYTPQHYAIQAAAHHDFAAFYEREIAFRREHGYPPFSQLARLLFTGTPETRVRGEAERVARVVREEIARQGLAGFDLLGPAPAYHTRLRGRYRWQLIVRAPDVSPLANALELPRGWVIDVDPVNLL
ncbi:MAG: primosomal protein N' [Chloroflexi bacterium]|nr:primosomal protein N' [Chloroflexota bacterium]